MTKEEIIAFIRERWAYQENIARANIEAHQNGDRNSEEYCRYKVARRKQDELELILEVITGRSRD